LKTVAIIPVKSFSKAKTRLSISSEKTVDICKIMLNEVLQTISSTNKIDNTIIVSRDESAFDIGKKFNVIQVFDESESGVNNAISLVDDYISDSEFDTSVILPQDIPFFNTSDLDNLFSFFQKNSVIIVPSRHFNGTNALLRNPAKIMTTRYDEGTYKSHLDQAKSSKIDLSLLLIRRLMLDIDAKVDIEFAMKQNEKPDICEKILDLVS
jgi:2-phospho-L-lactate guanylyltransferase